MQHGLVRWKIENEENDLHRSVPALPAIVEGALLVGDVGDHRVGAAVHQDLRDLAVHVLGAG